MPATAVQPSYACILCIPICIAAVGTSCDACRLHLVLLPARRSPRCRPSSARDSTALHNSFPRSTLLLNDVASAHERSETERRANELLSHQHAKCPNWPGAGRGPQNKHIAGRMKREQCVEKCSQSQLHSSCCDDGLPLDVAGIVRASEPSRLPISSSTPYLPSGMACLPSTQLLRSMSGLSSALRMIFSHGEKP